MNYIAVWSRIVFRIVVFAFLAYIESNNNSLPAQTKTLEGLVKDSQNGERLPNATVIIKGTRVATKTNTEGFFVFPGVSDSLVTLQVSYVGYASQEITVDTRKQTGSIVVKMMPRDITMEAVTVTAEQQNFLKTEKEVSLTKLSPKQLIVLPNVGQVDIFRSLQLLPGISATNDASSSLYVRGGTPDQNLVLFDGMTVYHVDHFFGFFSAFNPDAVKDVEIYKGGFPALYGGRLSSVVDIKGMTGDPNNYHFGLGVNLLSANAVLEVPLFKKGSLFFAVRRSYADILGSDSYASILKLLTGTDIRESTTRGINPAGGNAPAGFQSPSATLSQETPLSYFSDINAKITFNVTSTDIVSASLYSSGDDLDKSQSSRDQSVAGFSSSIRLPQTTDETAQGNLGVSAKWFRQWDKEFYSNVLFAYAQYSSDYTFGLEGSNLGGNSTNQNRFTTDEDNKVKDLTVRIDNQWYLGKDHELLFGTQISKTDVSYNMNSATAFVDSQSMLLSISASATQSAFYVQDKWKVLPLLDVTYGVRATHYSLNGKVYIEPRLSLRYSLTEGLSLKGAYGQYHQFVNRIINENLSEGSRDFWVLADSKLPPSKANHYILGATLEDENYTLDVEAYYKTLDALVEFSQRYRRASDDRYAFFSGTGTSKGVDILLQKKQGALTGWISYTLGRAEKTLPELNYGRSFPAEQDQTHELKVVGNLALGADWNVSSTFIFGSGKPYTAPVSQYYIQLLNGTEYSYTHVSEKNAYRLPSYQRWDLSVSKQFGDESFRWIAGITLFNVLNRKNISYYKYDLTSQPPNVTEVVGLGFTPTIFLQVDIR